MFNFFSVFWKGHSPDVLIQRTTRTFRGAECKTTPRTVIDLCVKVFCIQPLKVRVDL